jgi:hypothetical protein
MGSGDGVPAMLPCFWVRMTLLLSSDDALFVFGPVLCMGYVWVMYG